LFAILTEVGDVCNRITQQSRKGNSARFRVFRVNGKNNRFQEKSVNPYWDWILSGFGRGFLGGLL